MKVLVLMGGISLERDVSLASGAAITSALQNNGHDVIAVDTAEGSKFLKESTAQITDDIKTRPPDLEKIARFDRVQSLKIAKLEELSDVGAVFLAFHGGAGEDGTIQALLDLAGKKYTGSGMLSSALCMNKAISKKLFERDDIPTPDWMLIPRKDFDDEMYELIRREFPPPVIVKPNDQGSTVGLSLVERMAEYRKAIDLAFEVSEEALIEDYIDGRELTVSVLGEQALPVVEVLPKNKLYDYECKYTEGMCEYDYPAKIPDKTTILIQELGLRAFKTLDCKGYARVDFRMDKDGNLYCLEVNTLPGMTKTSLVPKAAKAAGYSFDQLIEKILKLAVED
ncbi:MAG: D-alanine--D-alanine ligase [candidate division Zixibacteria bacterium]|nr:D-alanine--D-alanine ligase [candidate division Zixibacteria bacterium]